MTFEMWLAFALACAVLLAIPGPTILMVIAHSLGGGRKAMRASVAGVALGDFTAMTASLMGLGALLAASATAFEVLKWAGAAYLVWLGIRLWRAPVGTGEAGLPVADAPGSGRIFFQSWLVTALNPKGLVFFVAFLPQFLDLSRPVLTQMVVMEVTFLTMAVLNASLYAWLAASARERIARPSVRRAVNRVGGTLMFAAALLAVGLRRAT